MHSKKNFGFTLIELLVVISIIGLLSTLAMVVLNDARIKARDVKRKHDLRQIAKAIELYRNNNNGDYPLSPNDTNIENYILSSSNFWDSFLSVEMPNMPLDPKNGKLIPNVFTPTAPGNPFDRFQYLYLEPTAEWGGFVNLNPNSGQDSNYMLLAPLEQPKNNVPDCDGKIIWSGGDQPGAPTSNDVTTCLNLDTGCKMANPSFPYTMWGDQVSWICIKL